MSYHVLHILPYSSSLRLCAVSGVEEVTPSFVQLCELPCLTQRTKAIMNVQSLCFISLTTTHASLFKSLFAAYFRSSQRKKGKVSAEFHTRHFYSTNVAATAFRALGVGYAAVRKNWCAEEGL